MGVMKCSDNLVSIYILCLCVCLSVCIQQTSKRLNQSDPNLLWYLTCPQGRFIDDQIFFCQNSIYILVLKISDFFYKIRKFFVCCFTMQCIKKLSIYILCLSVCLSVCLYSINVKTAEPIGPKIFVGSRVTPGKVYE